MLFIAHHLLRTGIAFLEKIDEHLPYSPKQAKDLMSDGVANSTSPYSM